MYSQEISIAITMKPIQEHKQPHKGPSRKTKWINSAHSVLVLAEKPNFIPGVDQCCLIFFLVEDSATSNKINQKYISPVSGRK